MFNAGKYKPQGLKALGKYMRGETRASTNYGEVNSEDYVQEFTNYPRQVLEFNSVNKASHPTQKPVALFEYLIKTYTNPGEVVLDNCAGSGTTGEACINTGRNYIQIEKDLTYYEGILEREANLLL